jgi:hypothetical protein
LLIIISNKPLFLNKELAFPKHKEKWSPGFTPLLAPTTKLSKTVVDVSKIFSQ